MKLLKLFIALLKDEQGAWFWPIVSALVSGAASGAMSGAMSGGGGGGGGGSPFGPITMQGLAAQMEGYAGEGLKKGATPYLGRLTGEQPPVEALTEQRILGRLLNPPQAEEYKSRVGAAKTQDIAREKESTQSQIAEERDMYNRLGLRSSTPWLNRAGEIGEESLMRQGDISSKYDMYGLNYGLNADRLVNDIINQDITQGQTLGVQQRGYDTQNIANFYNEFLRTSPEQNPYADAAMKLLGIVSGGGYNSGGDTGSSGLGGLTSGLGNLGTMALLKNYLETQPTSTPYNADLSSMYNVNPQSNLRYQWS